MSKINTKALFKFGKVKMINEIVDIKSKIVSIVT